MNTDTNFLLLPISSLRQREWATGGKRRISFHFLLRPLSPERERKEKLAHLCEEGVEGGVKNYFWLEINMTKFCIMLENNYFVTQISHPRG